MGDTEHLEWRLGVSYQAVGTVIRMIYSRVSVSSLGTMLYRARFGSILSDS